MKLCFLRAYGRGTMWRGGKTGPGILLALRSEYEIKRKEKKRQKKAEEEKQAKGLGFAACFGRS